MRKLSEAFSLGKSDVETVQNDGDFKVGFELEFIARPYGDKSRHRYKKIDQLSRSEFQEYMRPQTANVDDIFSRNFLPEYAQIFSTDPNFERLFPEYINLYKKSHRAWEQFYDTEEDLQRGIKPKFESPRGKLAIATQLLRAKGTDYMFRVWPVAKIVELTGSTPNYGFADTERTEIWTQQIEISNDLIIRDLQQTFGIRAASEGDSSRQWIVKRDGSLMPDGHNEVGVEIVSPPLPLPQSIDMMKKMFQWMKDRRHYTNASCGFHIGVSYKGPEEMRKIDKLKLAALLGEDYLLKLFNREANRYTYPLVDQLIKNLRTRQTTLQQLLKNKDMKALIAEVTARLDTSKYHTAHLDKLSQGYVEFRIAGGVSYHEDFEKIRITALRYAYIMKAALDPNAFREEYYKKLAKILLAAIPDDTGLTPEIADQVDPRILSYYKQVAPKVSDLTDFRSHFKDSLEHFINASKTEDRRHKEVYIKQATKSLVDSAVSIAREDRKNISSSGKKEHVLSTAQTLVLYRRVLKTYNVSKDNLREAIGTVPQIYQRFMNLFFGVETRRPATSPVPGQPQRTE